MAVHVNVGFCDISLALILDCVEWESKKVSKLVVWVRQKKNLSKSLFRNVLRLDLESRTVLSGKMSSTPNYLYPCKNIGGVLDVLENSRKQKWDNHFSDNVLKLLNFLWRMRCEWMGYCLPVVEPLIGDGAAKMFDFMWFLIDLGVAASLVVWKMSLLPPPKQKANNKKSRPWSRRGRPRAVTTWRLQHSAKRKKRWERK